MTTEHDRRGALEAVDRIVNRGGDDVVGEIRAVLERLYGPVEIRHGAIEAPSAGPNDVTFLRRVATVISAHVPRE